MTANGSDEASISVNEAVFTDFEIQNGELPDEMVWELNGEEKDVVASNNEAGFGILVEFMAPSEERPKAGGVEPTPDTELGLIAGLGAALNRKLALGGVAEELNSEEGIFALSAAAGLLLPTPPNICPELGAFSEPDVPAEPKPRNPVLLLEAIEEVDTGVNPRVSKLPFVVAGAGIPLVKPLAVVDLLLNEPSLG